MLLDGEDLRRLNPTRPLEMLHPRPWAPPGAERAGAGPAAAFEEPAAEAGTSFFWEGLVRGGAGLCVRALAPSALRPISAAHAHPRPPLRRLSAAPPAQVRVDVVEAPPNSSLIFFGHRGLRVRAVPTAAADAGAWPWREAGPGEGPGAAGSDDAPAIGGEIVRAKGGLKVSKECEFTVRGAASRSLHARKGTAPASTEPGLNAASVACRRPG